MEVQILPALKDNYMYMIIDVVSKEAAVVDPVDPDTILNAVANANVRLTKVLTTHHHWDHAGGNEKLVEKFSSQSKSSALVVYGGDKRIDAITKIVNEGDVFHIGALKVTCLFTPCHTTGHICYYIEAPDGERAVFTGDTLFQGGCGRFFEGTADQMYSALCEKLSSLPDDTQVFCGHEYTLQNLAFARHLEPQNKDILKRIEWSKIRRATNSPTVPSTIAQEKLWNPFMRVTEPAIQKYVGEIEPIKIMHAIRKQKDTFKA